MKEQWIKWEPIKGLAERYDIEFLYEGTREFKVELSQEGNRNNRVIITFEGGVFAYRNTDELFRCKLISDFNEKYGKDLYSTWTFFKVENSKYKQWLVEESCEIFDSSEYIHFSISTDDSILDIISAIDPKVELIENK